MNKQRKVRQHYPIAVTISIGKQKLETKLEIDLWGLVDPDNTLDQELVNAALNKMKVKAKKEDVKKLLEAHAIFHGKEHLMQIFTLWHQGDGTDMPWLVDAVDEYTVEDNMDFPPEYKKRKEEPHIRELIINIDEKAVRRLFETPETKGTP